MAGLVPLQLPKAVQLVALVVAQVSVADWPAMRLAGSAVKPSVGSGTLTVRLKLVVLGTLPAVPVTVIA